MADYIINIDYLKSKKDSLSSQKEKVNNINSTYLNKLSSTEIKGAISKITNNINRLKKGYNNSYNWFTKYINEISNLEDNIANYSLTTVDEPEVFDGHFDDIFSKATIPVLQTGADTKINYNKYNIPVSETLDGENKVSGNVLVVDEPIGIGTKYSLTDEEYAYLAWMAKKEQGSLAGAKLELSLMVNLYEKHKSKYKSVADYVRNGHWFSNPNSYNYPGEEYIQAAKEVVGEGKRYLTSNIVEHDWVNDITSISTGSVKNRSDYIPGKTIINNKFGARYVFIGFAPNNGDPFGYLI